MMIKCLKEGSDQNLALLELRNTPRKDTGESPFQMMFSRYGRTLIPENHQNHQESSRRVARKQQIKKSYVKRAKHLPKLKPGQNVYFEHRKGETWKCGQIIQETDQRRYLVESENSATYSRNRSHKRPASANVNIRDLSPPPTTTEEINRKATVRQKEPTTNTKGDAFESSNQLNTKTPNVGHDDQYSRPKRHTRTPKYLEDYVR